MNKDYFYLGIITKPFGYKGEVIIYIDADQPEKYQELDALFIDINGELIPYLIDKIQYRGGNSAIVRFSGLSPEEAKLLIKSEIYLPVSMLPPLSGNQFYFHEVIGFSVIDKEKGEIGVCDGFIEVTQQPVMQIIFEGKEILVPAVDEFIISLDREKKIIFIDAPEELIDIYL